jgi:hypothetical protein
MRILDQDNDRAIGSVFLLLTRQEALQLHGLVACLLKDPTTHAHVPSDDYSKEVTVAAYDPEHPEAGDLGERALKLIREDEWAERQRRARRGRCVFSFTWQAR